MMKLDEQKQTTAFIQIIYFKLFLVLFPSKNSYKKREESMFGEEVHHVVKIIKFLKRTKNLFNRK